MGFWEILLIGFGLSMDAFAVSVCKGLNMKKLNFLQGTIIALFFGFFQFLMPVIGYFFCSQFEVYIQNFDHWICFGLLCFIGVKMIVDTVLEEKSQENLSRDADKNLNIKELFVLAIATSIDALAVGISLAFFDVNIFVAGGIIGITTFVLSFVGVVIGNFFGEKFKKPAQISGGVILVLIGLKILLEHLGVIAF